MKKDTEDSFLKRISIFIGIVAGIVTLVWGTSTILYAKADTVEVDKIEERLRYIENNDVKQTVILERIERKIDKLTENDKTYLRPSP